MDYSTLPAKRDHAHLEESFDDGDVRRARRTSMYHLPPPPPTIDKQDRRRVNPEALSSRLGPQIVAELDALIPPGSIEMPSFAARKHVQQRFNIDRRHIYDYYHAKGLRVLRDDRTVATPSSSQQEASVAEAVCVARARYFPRSLTGRPPCRSTMSIHVAPRGLCHHVVDVCA
jgi:hypothetical protein